MKQEWNKQEINFVLKLYARGLNRKEIARQFNEKFYARSQDSIKHCIDVYGIAVEKFVPKVLILDIETRSLTVKTFGLRDQNIGLEQIVDDGGILCWSAKWLGTDEVFYEETKGDKSKEKTILKKLKKLMDDADIILGQNSQSFDVPIITGLFLYYGLIDDVKEFKQIDTLRMSRSKYKFLSHKLQYMSGKLCEIKKQTHAKFPGMSLWMEYEAKNPLAFAEMKKYNMADVEATEELFLKLAKGCKTKNVTDALRAYELAKQKKRK
jgi:DNA polymerase elongation subunit (family B)